jgi:septum formation protein
MEGVIGNLILASASPRRRELLENAGIVFSVRPANVGEIRGESEPPTMYVRRLAQEKALAARQYPHEWVLGADTTVVAEGSVLEKPGSREEAYDMIARLEGRAHEVVTGICLLTPQGEVVDHAVTRVVFRPMAPAEIEDYVASDEPYDKAGGYAIQGLASKFVERIEGCHFNVVGLPVSLVYHHLRMLSSRA